MDDEHPADFRRVLARPGPGRGRPDPGTAAERAGLRLVLLLLGTLAVGVAAVPLALLVGREFPPLIELDQELSRAAEAAVSSSQALLLLAQLVTLLGDPFLITGLAGVLAVTLLARGRRRLALYVVAARAGALVLSQGLKALLDRVRPVFDDPVATADGASFPSGHALGSAAFSVTTVVVLLPFLSRAWRRLAWVLAVVVPVAVAASRVLLGVHFASDVAGGLLLGAGWAALATAAFAAWRADEGRPVEPLEEGLDPETGR